MILKVASDAMNNVMVAPFTTTTITTDYYYYRLLEKRMATLKSILYQMLFLFNILSKQYMFYSLLCQHSLKLNFIHPLLRSKEF